MKRGEEVDPVITPAVRTGKLGDRHDFDRGDAQLRQPGEPLCRGGPGSLTSERAQMQLVKYLSFQAQPFPSPVVPRIRIGINSLGRTVGAMRLKP